MQCLLVFAEFLLITVVAAATCFGQPARTDEQAVDRRVYGLLIGSAIGDAAGGPVEFASREKVGDRLPGFRDRLGERVDAAALEQLASRFPLLPYEPIRPDAEPYGQWTNHASAGTVTDDTRNKMVLLDAVRRAVEAGAQVDRRSLAEAYLRFDERPEVTATPGWRALCKEGFGEFELAARWELGERDPAAAAPPSRLWGGVGTCCGQMTLPPLAGIFPGDSERAYRASYAIAFIDNGDAKDLNAAFVAGLAFALTQPSPGDDPAARRAAWRAVLDVMQSTDPLRFGEIPFMTRPVVRWIEAGREAARDADGSPAELYRRIAEACPDRLAWEASFLLTQAVALGEFCPHEPLAAMHLALDYGEDTDSSAQLLGALFGAMYGPDLFPAVMRTRVEERIAADYGESLDEWVVVIAAARRLEAEQRVVTPHFDSR